MTAITIVGNVTRDPELRYIPSGTQVATFGVAVGSRRKTASGDWEDGPTSFFDVTCWRDLAANVAESITKGDRVVVTGRLEVRDWEAEGGKKGRSAEVTADDVGASMRWATVVVQRNERRQPATVSESAPPDPSEEPL